MALVACKAAETLMNTSCYVFKLRIAGCFHKALDK
jgi:hypothetical protein